ncbi:MULTISPECIES: hypothetical protein [unclassified Pseudomonas]|uniref:hypothetical protein n=1 Tax=unclassified Pseudomonas TaxID=196821 RepID=UPI001FD54B0A|nr:MULTISPECIES: hypothetical protein [unclassified Pseudomonas]
MKEQRDQDQRRHESQLHQAQVEQRKLQETLVLKQDDLTRLNRDNERLLGESRQQVKTLHAHEARIQTLTGEIQALKLSESRAIVVAEQIQEQLAVLRQERETLTQAATLNNERVIEARMMLATAEAELQLHRRHPSELTATEPALAESPIADAVETEKTKVTKNARPSRK